jgi:hypothetical protein
LERHTCAKARKKRWSPVKPSADGAGLPPYEPEKTIRMQIRIVQRIDVGAKLIPEEAGER